MCAAVAQAMAVRVSCALGRSRVLSTAVLYSPVASVMEILQT